MFGSLNLSYMDILVAPFLLAGLHQLRQRRYARFTWLYIAACSIKYPPLIIAPFLLVHVTAQLRQDCGASVGAIGKRLLAVWFLPWLMAALLLLGVFGLEPIHALLRTLGHHELTNNALNFNWTMDALDPAFDRAALAQTLFLCFYAGSLLAYLGRRKTFENLLLHSILGHLSYFSFAVGVHENHLFLSTLLAVFLACSASSFVPLALNLCLISTLNMFEFYGTTGMNADMWWPKGALEDRTDVDLAWSRAGYPFDHRCLLAVFNTLYCLVTWTSVVLDRRR
jgi:hypothetical protein